MSDRTYRYVGPGDVPSDAPAPVRFHELPTHVALDETIASQPASPPPDPTMGHDTETEFMLRNAAG